MKKIDGIWAWLGGAALLVSLSAVTTACESDSDDGQDGGAGGQGGGSSTGGTDGGAGAGTGGGGGEAASCEPPTFEAGGGAGGEGGASGNVIEIAGEYDDSFGGTQTITTTSWDSSGSVFYFSQVDNEEGFAIAQTAEDGLYNPCNWNRFEWMIDGADIYYCQSAFGEATEAEALAAARADQDDLEGGCGGFEWTPITLK